MNNNLKREQQRKNRFGLDAKCQICGVNDSRTFEEHHLLGSGEGETIILCRNCHAQVTDGQLDLPAELFRKNRSETEQALAFFGMTGIILSIIAVLCFQYVTVLYNTFNQFIRREQPDESDETFKNSNQGTY